MTVNAPKKQRGRPWRKGESGNPKGKPPGTRHKATRAVDALLDGEAEALTRVAIQRALTGDTIALRLCLDRIAPIRKGRPVYLDLPPIETAADVSAAMARLVEAMAGGDVTPEEAATVASVIELRRKAIETEELEARLRALEARNALT